MTESQISPVYCFIGIDPGKSGAMAAITESGSVIGIIKNTETERDLWEWIKDKRGPGTCTFIMIEQVNSMPKQGVASTWKFASSYGFLRGLGIAAEVTFNKVAPNVWQTSMRCRSKGNKNITKARAQELFPGIKITHAIADALLIAEYCRWKQLPLLPGAARPSQAGGST